MRLSAISRLSLGLAALTVSLLLFAELLGLTPDTRRILMDARQKVGESLAVQLSVAATRSDMVLVQETLDALVERNPDVLSAATRRANGEIFSQAGNHALYWMPIDGDKSTLTHVFIPIFAGAERWGAVEVSFVEPSRNWIAWLRDTIWGLVLFTLMTAFGTFYFVLRRALRELDPRGTIPQRIKAAFDALTEGVLVLDDKGQIVLTNTAFAQTSGRSPSDLIGCRASELGWKDAVRPAVLPWEQTLAEGKSQTRVTLQLADTSGGFRTLVANSAPILDDKRRRRGVLVTFDDVTAIEKSNEELALTVVRLRESEHEIKRRNKQLYHLATHDSLTDCLNRRAFFASFNSLFRKVREEGLVLSCLMVDIDHFKSINDRFGHDAGDKVIRRLAALIRAHVGPEDLVCRYGGEEFCVVLPRIDIFQSAAIAQKIRHEIEEDTSIRFGTDARVTISVGASSTRLGAKHPAEIITQADQALYIGKSSGRNRVVRWTAEAAGKIATRPSARCGLDGRDAEGVVAPDTRPAAVAGADLPAGLPRRLIFAERIAREIQYARQHGKHVAILSLVPSHFRRIRDTLGPAVGDAMLAKLAARLHETLRSSDMVARLDEASDPSVISRLGEDEFGIVVTGLDGEGSVRKVLKRLFRALSTPTEVDEHTIDLGVSVGIAVASQGGDTPELLLKNAATARHDARERSGINRYQFYSKKLDADSIRRAHIARELPRALDTGQIVLHFQPQQDLSTGAIVCWEALLRWTHPDLGEISPMEFVPIAEETGFIGRLGEWVLLTSCLQAKAWADDGFGEPRIAVNLSPVQLQHPDIVEQIRGVLTQTGLEPRRLELEITESTIMQDKDLAERTLRELKDFGVRIAIDDFGTGYSSLSYIKSFPADVVKIDRFFLGDVTSDDRASELYGAIVDMARRLNLYVVAEGVESEDQLDFVARLGCDAMQGYLLSPAMGTRQAAEFMRYRREQAVAGHARRTAGG